MKHVLSTEQKNRHHLTRARLEIDLDALGYNAKQLKSWHGGAKMTAVVKADAYGHGSVAIARYLEDHKLTERFAVATVDEALRLREAGISLPIEILSLTARGRLDDVVRLSCCQVLCSIEEAEALNEAAALQGKKALCHVATDVGMNRIGIPIYETNPEGSTEVLKLALHIEQLEHLELEALMTHFPQADDASQDEKTLELYQRFCALTERVQESLGRPILSHCSNSAFFIRHPELTLDFYRPGIALYGLLPDDCDNEALTLKPVAALKAEVSYVKEVPKDSSVSYGQRYTFDQKASVATLACGYADGYARALGDRARVCFENQATGYVRGVVCMDAMMVEVKGDLIPEVGSSVLLFGDEGPSLTELAEQLETIHYELLCRISSRVPRVYIADQKLIALQNAQQGYFEILAEPIETRC